MDFQQLLPAIAGMSWKNMVMIAIGLTLIFLAIRKQYEPTLLLPIGFGTILVNIPFSAVLTQGDVLGPLNVFFDAGIITEVFPLLIFVAIGAMIDFSPLFQRPILLLFGAAAQFGIFMTMVLATLMGFDIKQAASIGIIGAADGPTSIIVATQMARDLLGPISVAAYSYMALVPIIQPPVIKALTSEKERKIRMKFDANKRASRTAHNIPYRRYRAGRAYRSFVAGSDRLPYVRQPYPRVWCAQQPVADGTERTCKPRHHTARYHYRKHYDRREIRTTEYTYDTRARHRRFRVRYRRRSTFCQTDKSFYVERQKD